jgi:hypothetical protein
MAFLRGRPTLKASFLRRKGQKVMAFSNSGFFQIIIHTSLFMYSPLMYSQNIVVSKLHRDTELTETPKFVVNVTIWQPMLGFCMYVGSKSLLDEKRSSTPCKASSESYRKALIP